VSDRYRVVLADDHAPTRAIVREALEGQDFEAVADVGDAPAAVAGGLRR
jgi:DNA-binding NarL/FixJ family response regulator